MNREWFLDYIATYNADKSGLSRFYAPDLVFENAAMTLAGDALGAFFQSLHGVISDRIEPVRLVVDEDGAALLGKHVFTALQDADLPIGAMKTGESKSLVLFAFYETKADRITRIRLTYWPDGRA